MISYLQGKLLSKDMPFIVIDIAGVGYEVELSLTSFYALPECGQTVQIITHLVVREDAQYLIGFMRREERSLFRELIRVSGIGPKLALAILSSIEPQAFIQCIVDNDTTRLTKLPGIGKKTAQRLLLDLHDRLLATEGSPVLQTATAANATTSHVMTANQVMQEASQALEALAFKAPQAKAMVSKIFKEGMSSEEVIRRALQGVTTSA